MLLICHIHFCLACRWEKYQIEEEAALGRGKRLRKAVSYREAYAPHPSEIPCEVIVFTPFNLRDLQSHWIYNLLSNI